MQPQSLTVGKGANVSFNAAATAGGYPIYYQWQFNDVAIPGATSPTLTLKNVQQGNAGRYSLHVDVFVFNVSLSRYLLAASTVSDDAILTVVDTVTGTLPAIMPVTFNTMAGLAGFFGSVNGTGSDARFRVPSGVAVDSAGNVYVADHGNHTIRKMTPGGIVTTLAGLAGNPGSANGTGSDARFNSPNGVAVDNADNIYVGDGGNHTIRKVTPTGEVTTLAGQAGSSGSVNGTGSVARFSTPFGVAVDSAGNVYVAGYNNNSIRKVTPAGVVTTLAGGSQGSADGTGSAARFFVPSGVAVDSAGIVYVADTFNKTIRKVTPEGVVTTLAGQAGSSGSADGMGSAARFSNPYGVAVDKAGNVYVADYANHTIRKVTPEGVVRTLAGQAGSSGSANGTDSAARFRSPQAVTVDGAGNVYVADTSNDTIRKGVPQGNVAPSILSPPQSQTVNAGGSVTFTVYADGSLPMNYQWLFNGVVIPSAVNYSLTLNNVQPGNAGSYTVLISNAAGSTISRTATLAVQGDPANGDPSTPVTITLPAKSDGKNNLIIITHGWQPSFLPWLFPDVNWIHDMANAIDQKIASQLNWQVWTVDWKESAFCKEPGISFQRATNIGNLLGPQIARQGWSHVHFIGHSAGAGLIQAAAHQIKNTPQNATTVHTTFLDPFSGDYFENRNIYGQDADWSDTYFARDFTGWWTTAVPNSHSVDVTDLDPDHSISEILHSWPYKFYARTVTGDLADLLGDTSGYGFHLSMEGGGWANKGNYPPTGNNPKKLPLGTETLTFTGNLPSNARPENNQSKLTVSGGVLPTLTSTTGTLQFTPESIKLLSGQIFLRPLSPQTASRASTVAVAQSLAPASAPVLEPAWVSIGVTVTNPVNYVKFDAEYTSATGAQGLFCVYWGTNLVGELDERTASTGFQTYRFLLPDTYTDGQYTLGFRLDAYTTTQSSLTLTNVMTGFIGITNPPALSVTASAPNGPAQITLTGALGFYSILQTSTNLINWTSIAALVNSNGVVQFNDTGATNQTRRFYRAVVP